ncbi:MAG TPA: prolyl oligopeptidase family serine peptidase [Bacteroidales bacterium]|nr:prolyl oligopeptidase family serine peptidase [Bacteroidales bacterium]
MKNLFILMAIAMLVNACATKHEPITYPEPKRGNHVDVYFGTEVADPYRWLEDDNSDETALWVAAQNVTTQSYLSRIKFREDLRQRFETIWNYPRVGTPFKEAGRYYLFRNDGLQNQSVLYTMKSLDETPEVLLDPNNFSTDGTISLGNISPSPGGKYFAYSISRGGSDWNEIVVMDLETRALLPDTIRWVKFSGISWLNDEGFFYSAYDAPAPGQALSGSNEYHKLYYHKLGTPQTADVIIFQNKEFPKRNYYGGVTDGGSFLVVRESQATSGNALYLRPAGDFKAPFKKIADGFDYDYDVIDELNGKLLVVTNYDAPKRKVVLIDPAAPSPENWKTIIPEAENVLGGVSLAGPYIYADYVVDASNRAYFFDYEGNMVKELEFPTLGTTGGFSGDKDDPEAFYTFTSFTFPSTIYRYDLNTHTSEKYFASEVQFNPEEYVTEQVFFTSKDGTKVPMFIVYKKGMQRNGKNPLLMYGYGGFNISVMPSFSVSRLPFLEQGGIYVSVNLRGGGEYGKKWHEAGQKMNKQNVFDDFISAAEYLIAEQYTNPSKIAIMGGSNGGLLVGAAMTQRPDLFKVAIPIVGVLDMLRYQYFTIGWAWAADYGRSDESEEMFRYLLAYSPLHNVKSGVAYPSTLAVTADHDDRVVPAHTFKFMAELQSKHTGKNPVLVRIETQAGHGAGKPTSKLIEENTDIYSFIMYELGMKPKFARK